MKIAKLLLAGIAISTFVMHAAEQTTVQTNQLELKQNDAAQKELDSKLATAVRTGDIKAVHSLLNAKADPNCKTQPYQTPWGFIIGGEPILSNAIKKWGSVPPDENSYFLVISQLLLAKADPNSRESNVSAPLLNHSVLGRHWLGSVTPSMMEFQVFKLLLAFDADITLKDEHGKSICAAIENEYVGSYDTSAKNMFFQILDEHRVKLYIKTCKERPQAIDEALKLPTVIIQLITSYDDAPYPLEDERPRLQNNADDSDDEVFLA